VLLFGSCLGLSAGSEPTQEQSLLSQNHAWKFERILIRLRHQHIEALSIVFAHEFRRIFNLKTQEECLPHAEGRKLESSKKYGIIRTVRTTFLIGAQAGACCWHGAERIDATAPSFRRHADSYFCDVTHSTPSKSWPIDSTGYPSECP